MSIEQEIDALRRHLEWLAGDTDDDLIGRYELKRPQLPPGFYWRLRWLAGWVVRWFRSVSGWRPDPWPVRLRQSSAKPNARPLVIWAVGADRESLRDACGGFSRLAESVDGFAPVLVTDVADFAFFSRLGWLVEYLPALPGEGVPYEQRKARFLARLYRGAVSLPLSVGLQEDFHGTDIRVWLNSTEPEQRAR